MLNHQLPEGTQAERLGHEIGASGIGSHTIIYQKHFKNVVAIEPQNALFPLLEKTAGENTNVVKKVAAHQNGYCCFTDGVSDEKVSYGSRGICRGESTYETVTIDSLNLTDVDLIKMDTEGSEFLVIYGARETIKKYHPVIMFETIGEDIFKKKMADFCGDQVSFDPVQFLKDQGYNHFKDYGKNKVCIRKI